MKVSMVEIDNPDELGDDSQELTDEKPEGVEALGLGVSETVESALAGTLSPEYTRKYYENDSLKPKHMKMLRMAVAGYSNNQIAAAMDYTPARVSIILNHQDSLAIMARMVGAAADRMGVAERLQALAPEMIEHVVGITRTTHDNKLRSRNAFELLKIAGYSGVNKVEVVSPGAATAANTKLLNKLVSVLEESNALLDSKYDPRSRSLSVAAQGMLEGQVVEATGNGPSPEPVEGAGLSVHPAVPPGRESLPLDPPSAVAAGLRTVALGTEALVREPVSADQDRARVA